VAVVELFLDRVPAKKAAPGFARPHFAPPAPGRDRDFAFLVDAKVPAGDVLRAVKGADKASIVAPACSTISAARRSRRPA
jgi:phenylalanyl-tRNA synthetase beta chain